jgi:precorrin-3B C17-methyltransferase
LRTSSINNSGKEFKSNTQKNQTQWDDCGNSRGQISVVGIGPGSLEHLTPKARKAIEEADVVVGYGMYIKLIQTIISKDAEIISGTMGKEVERAQLAVRKANENHRVVMVSSGDPGVYGMAGIVLEVADQEKTQTPIEIIPGITAASSAASILGAPLISDFAVISLSDLLTPLEKIEKRLELAAQADMSIVLYNPQSQGRTEPLIKAYEILTKHINPNTPAGIVKQAGREGQQAKITTLKNPLNEEIDMLTTIVIGNTATKIINNKMVTKRGYNLTN